MKQFVTMLKFRPGEYSRKEPLNPIFFAITRLFSPFIFKGKLIEWYNSDKPYFTGSSYIGIRKNQNFIEIHNLPSEIFESTDPESEAIFEQEFIMSKENFLQIITQWDELRVSGPDVILVVMHEDNHLSLETDPVIIKEYQDAGYAFDYNKEKK